MGYFNDVVKGFSWSVALRGYTRLLTLARIIVLARFLLSPYEFGLFGYVTLTLSLLEILTETGINVFLIQEVDSLRKYINSAWILSIIRGTLIALILLATAYPIAMFFNSPPTTALLLVTAIIPFVRGFINPSEILFQKELTFEKDFLFNGSLLTIETVSIIIFALFTHSAYSFIAGMIVSAIAEVIISHAVINPKPKLIWNFSDIRNIFHKGKWVTLYGIFQYFAQNGDNITVGKVLGANSLAIYANAYNLSILPVSEIVDVTNKVVFPVFVKINGERTRLLHAFAKAGAIVIALVVPFSLFLGYFSKEIVLLTFGTKWLEIAQILPLLCVYGAIRAISGYTPSLLLALKKQRWVATTTLVRFVSLIIAVIPLTIMWGIQGTVCAALVSAIVEIPVNAWYTYKAFQTVPAAPTRKE